MSKQAGFTLIELVVVLVLLGILGAVATARFQDLSVDAAEAAEAGVAGELSSASAINYAVSAAGGTPDVAISGTIDCTAASPLPDLLQAGALPADITPADGADVACTGVGDTVECTVEHGSGNGTPETVTLICTG